MLNPRQARDFAKATGQLAKTERVDAKMLAIFGTVFPETPRTQELNPTIAELRALSVRRSRLVQPAATLKIPIKAVGDGPRLGPVRCKLLEHIKSYEDEITELIVSSETLATRDQIRLSVPGIGSRNAAGRTAWTPELGSIGGRQAAVLLGVAPFARDSGKLSGTRHLAGGHRRPRNRLYMAALAASVHNANLREPYQRLIQRRKPPRVALVAVRRKLIVLANTLLHNNRLWAERTPSAA